MSSEDYRKLWLPEPVVMCWRCHSFIKEGKGVIDNARAIRLHALDASLSWEISESTLDDTNKRNLLDLKCVGGKV